MTKTSTFSRPKGLLWKWEFWCMLQNKPVAFSICEKGSRAEIQNWETKLPPNAYLVSVLQHTFLAQIKNLSSIDTAIKSTPQHQIKNCRMSNTNTAVCFITEWCHILNSIMLHKCSHLCYTWIRHPAAQQLEATILGKCFQAPESQIWKCIYNKDFFLGGWITCPSPSLSPFMLSKCFKVILWVFFRKDKRKDSIRDHYNYHL